MILSMIPEKRVKTREKVLKGDEKVENVRREIPNMSLGVYT